MTAMGQQRKSRLCDRMSASPPKAEIAQRGAHVRKVPLADIGPSLSRVCFTPKADIGSDMAHVCLCQKATNRIAAIDGLFDHLISGDHFA
jgi:hypothetical protein